MSRQGLRTEILASLALVMFLASLVLVAVLVTYHEQGLRHVLGRSLRAEAIVPPHASRMVVAGTEWWTVDPSGLVQRRGAFATDIDPTALDLADQARKTDRVLLQLGGLWDPIRFAAPVGREGRVAVARLPREASVHLRTGPLAVVALLGLANVVVFTAFGARMLRNRVLQPLEAVAATAAEIGSGAGTVRAPEEGPAEVAEVARALNEMTDTLQGQSEDLEKAVSELRGVNRDLRQARAGLDRAERLASVGHLAAGVAHEVGNPIGAILAFIDLAARDQGLSEEARGHLERAGKEGERVRVILRQLLDFSRPTPAEARPMNFVATAQDTLALITPQRRYAKLEFEGPGSDLIPTVLGDPSAVTQILLNLLMNAADAIGAGEAGRIAVRLRKAVLDRRAGDPRGAPPPDRGGNRAGDAVECLVCDSGRGIPEEDRERVFDPFYTTKDPGEGTGLGLANCVRLAQEFGGTVEWVPAPEGFTTALALRLPVASTSLATGGGSLPPQV